MKFLRSKPKDVEATITSIIRKYFPESTIKLLTKERSEVLEVHTYIYRIKDQELEDVDLRIMKRLYKMMKELKKKFDDVYLLEYDSCEETIKIEVWVPASYLKK